MTTFCAFECVFLRQNNILDSSVSIVSLIQSLMIRKMVICDLNLMMLVETQFLYVMLTLALEFQLSHECAYDQKPGEVSHLRARMSR